MDDTCENDKHKSSSTMTDNKDDLSTMGDNNATKAEHEHGTGRGNGYDECGGDEQHDDTDREHLLRQRTMRVGGVKVSAITAITTPIQRRHVQEHV